ncbi:MAG: thiamine pyrophosphate-binding protein [Flavobacteriaceae bacterium]
MPDYTVSDLVAEFLSACGVRTAFGIVSVHNVPLLDAIGRRNAIRFVPARGETGGGHMADAYARVIGGLGVVITSTGPAAANAVPALVEARFAGSPLLHITGQTATRFLGRDAGTVHDVPGQSEMLRATGKACMRISRAEEAFGVLMAAAGSALSAPMGPVSVEIPIDVQRAPVQRPSALDDLRLPVRPPVQPGTADLDDLASRVRDVKRPMLWLGNGARGAGPAARRLLDLGFGMVNSWRGRAIVPDDHPATLGAMHGSGVPRIEAFYDTVDLMIVTGSRLRGHETLDNQLRLPARRIRIDVDPLADGRTYASEMFVCADASLALEGLADRLERVGYRADPGLAKDLAEARREAAEQYRATLGPYKSFPEQLRAAMPRDTIFVRDATVAGSTWGHRLVPLYGERDSVHSVGAAIGLGLPFGIGAALAAARQGRKAVALVGDGGFALALSELWTAIQEKVDLTIVVMNDGLYSQIAHIQDAVAGGRRFYDRLEQPDLIQLAAVAGLPARRVSRAEEFGEAIAEAISRTGPSLVEVDMHTIGPVPPAVIVTGVEKKD